MIGFEELGLQPYPYLTTYHASSPRQGCDSFVPPTDG
jgi:hypothetical protein